MYVGQIIQTEDGPEKVIAVDEQGSYVTEVLEQLKKRAGKESMICFFSADKKIINYFYFLCDQL